MLQNHAIIRSKHNNITASGLRITANQELVIGNDISLRDANFLLNSRGAVEVVVREPNISRAERIYSGASNLELLATWRTSSTSANQELYPSLEILRNRCHALLRNSAFANRIRRLYIDNIVGKNGITLQAKTKSRAGNLDNKANKIIEKTYAEWSGRKNCTVTGDMSSRKVQELAITSLLTSGELFIRKVIGNINKFGYAWQIIEPELIPLDLNSDNQDGTYTVMGVDYNQWGRPIAYNIIDERGGTAPSAITSPGYSRRYRKIPANQMRHVFNRTRAGMTRGEPILACVIEEIKMLDCALDSTLLEIIVNAKKMGFIERPPESRQTMRGIETKDIGGDRKAYVDRLSSGTVEDLPPGAVFKSHAPNTPSGTLEPFVESILKLIASGVDVPFVDLANSYAGMNYSTSKSQATKAKESWKSKQKDFIIEPLLVPSFEDDDEWLDQALLTGALPLNPLLNEKYKDIEFRGRGFSHNDPEKEAKGFSKLISLGLASRTSILQETTGENYDDVIAELAKEEEIADKMGVNVAPSEHAIETDDTTQEVKDDEENETATK